MPPSPRPSTDLYRSMRGLFQVLARFGSTLLDVQLTYSASTTDCTNYCKCYTKEDLIGQNISDSGRFRRSQEGWRPRVNHDGLCEGNGIT